MTKKQEKQIFENMYEEYNRCKTFVKENNRMIYEKVVELNDDENCMRLNTRYYNYQGSVFAERTTHDFCSELNYRCIMFELGAAGRQRFYKVALEQDLLDGRVITRYNIAEFYKGEVRRKELSSDMFDVMTDKERSLVSYIQQCRSDARYCDYLQKVGISKEKDASI